VNQNDNSRFSEVATLSNGNAVVVLQDEFGGLDNDCLFSIITPGGAFVRSLDLVVGAGSAGEEADPDVAALKGGGFVVVWTDDSVDGAGLGIEGALYDNAGGFITNFTANATTGGNQQQANAVALADGGFVVTWNDAGFSKVRGRRFDASGAPVGDEFDVKNGLAGAGPQAALLGDGRFAYALDHTAGDTDVVSSIFDPRTSPINGSPGDDRITSRREGATVNGGNGQDELIGLAANDVLNGGDGNDILRGRGGDDIVNGGKGADTLHGSSGNDTMIGGNSIDTADYSLADGPVAVSLAVTTAQNTGGAGIDTLFSIEYLTGSEFGDTLTGSAGSNILTGGIGNDDLRGGGGQDFLVGGANDDIFRYNAISESGTTGATRDVISEFVQMSDQIHLIAIDANTGLAGNQAFTFIGAAAFSGVAGQLRSVRSGPITLIAGDVNGDSAADFAIQIGQRLLMTTGDFLL
jgi:Ca2+-binding RTX toxin-like protein